ncbi:tetratricopeptide repeat protein [Mycolicibacterium chlorophenolicum]|uniref:Mce associated membrane protein n=1 Tax=Mycolicibacterium chlorophenolicum TaxID=37916 RepID=A0A0J6ZG34_9MYCO|nr:hypothetical protein [Mycolicibacterium chlorophenolicum]KMO83766.1 hypothetical protein MCHLDSM_00226 [Mycolicibacterium chlorophenolicum]
MPGTRNPRNPSGHNDAPDDGISEPDATDIAPNQDSDSDSADDGPTNPSPAGPDDSLSGTVDYDSETSDDSAQIPTSDPVDDASQHVPQQARPGLRAALVASVLIVAALGGLIGYLGYRTYQTQAADRQRELFLQTGRQAAINLTTISYAHVDADVARILDSATGTFHDDFQQRVQPFIDVVKQAQSTSEGNVTAAGVESINGDQAQVIVAVSVKTSNAGAPDQQPRGWRMRLNVQKIGDTAKVSDVQFVP